MNTLTRILQTGCVGKDVEGVTRAMLRYLEDDKGWRQFIAATPVVRRFWGPGKTTFAKRCSKKAGLPEYGVFGPKLEATLRDAGAFDLKANKLLDDYADSVTPKLVEPKQGFNSLDSRLWDAFSLGRNSGFSDLGTHNSASRLPSGRPSDHAVYPAVAFDLGFFPATGWNNLKARAYTQRIAGRKEVAYVICGNRIHTRYGWGSYYAGGHEGHIHVSGHR